MKWFVGSIQEAVHASKQKKAIFVAFIEGKDDTSTQLSQIIESREISSRLEQDHFVAIKIESGTETYRFFAQIYQLVPVPCIYFIDAVGSPIEVVANNCQISELAVKIDDMLVKQGKTASGSSTSFIKSEQKATTVSAPTNVTTLENNSPIASQAEIQSSQESTSELTHEEKVKRAQQLIELQKKQRIEEEIKKGKERELERRKRERELQELRLKQRDLEIKQSHEERLKEKADDAAARERVRQQIAQDKLLRKEKELALKKQATQQSEKQQIITPQSSNNDSSLTRIQFRLPSGSTHMGQFEPTVTLGTLRDYVSTNIEIPFQQFTLSTSFPRRDLLVEDDNKTLTELGLIPTCVILILPLKNSNSKSIITSSKDIGFLSRIIWTIFSPVIGVYNYVMRYFFNTNRGPGRSQNDEPNSGEFSNTANENNSQDVSNMQRMGGLHRRNLGTGSTKVFKVQGNIHRLHSPRDDDDENNTWNGNSTQQM
ncbi:UBX domain-containing protein 4 isoform X2 [Leptopilina boulardi]|uniref:UBX domain-containing protein 4 isoform X2 n=1 Tax=Leptopilina boulardi TaxID=63433 RepID=UPI0021F64DF8|nr:UBX domain-containing protein 4 isoform X2 [Leptopilina boulardi]